VAICKHHPDLSGCLVSLQWVASHRSACRLRTRISHNLTCIKTNTKTASPDKDHLAARHVAPLVKTRADCGGSGTGSPWIAIVVNTIARTNELRIKEDSNALIMHVSVQGFASCSDSRTWAPPDAVPLQRSAEQRHRSGVNTRTRRLYCHDS